MLTPSATVTCIPGRNRAWEFRSTSSSRRGTRMSLPTCRSTGSPTAPCTTGEGTASEGTRSERARQRDQGVLMMDPDRLFPADPATRAIARELYAEVRGLPLVCPHGHVDPALLAEDAPLPDPAALFVAPDHYLTRMLYSQGVPPQQVGVPDRDGRVQVGPREAWRTFCEHWYLFRGTPSRLWLEQSLAEIFGVTERLGPKTADAIYDELTARIAEPAYRPRALLRRFGIEVLATTDSPTDSLDHHARLAADGWAGPRGGGAPRPPAPPRPPTAPPPDSLDHHARLAADGWAGPGGRPPGTPRDHRLGETPSGGPASPVN